MLTQNPGAPLADDSGLTNLDKANQFIVIRTSGVRDIVQRLINLAGAASAPKAIEAACRKASEPLFAGYQQRAREHEATGNLAKSVMTIYRAYPSGGAAITGPRQTGTGSSKYGVESGNHAWLVEFGTGPRKPGSRGRRAYINVHQSINRRMDRAGSFNNTQFEKMGRGYYFLMGSAKERGTGSKYSRDFAGPGPGGDGRKQHPISLGPGDEIAPMRPEHLMQDTIAANSRKVFSILKNALETEIAQRGGA